MLDLFSENVEPLCLHILYNDEPWKGSFDDLLDSNRFTDVCICTYVTSSLSFLFEKLQGFKTVSMIIGQEDGEAFKLPTANLTSLFNTKLEESLLALSPDFLRRIYDKGIEVRYPKEEEAIHSKIYVLKGKGITRVMVGSANFTQTAVGGDSIHGERKKHIQYEELVVYDSDYNPKFTKEFEDRFNYLWSLSLELKSPTFKQKISEKIIQADQLSANKIDKSIIIANQVNAGNISNSSIFPISDDIKGKIIAEKIEQQGDTISNVSNVIADIDIARVTSINGLEESERTSAVANNIVKKEGGRLKFKNIVSTRDIILNAMRKKIRVKTAVLDSSDSTEKKEETRNVFDFDTSTFRIIIKDNRAGLASFYSQPISNDDLKVSLKRVESFVRSYAKFSSVEDSEKVSIYERKIFEAILYAFVSPFIWCMRRDAKANDSGSEEKVTDLTPLLIIGGVAGTGKTKLLLFINRLLGNNYDIYDYRKLDKRGKKDIEQLLKDGNLFPTIVDEVSQNMFRGEGEEVIKSFVNGFVDPHTCFIGATNQEFISETQVVRRIYYLDLQYAIMRSRMREANQYFKEEVEMNKINDQLFKAFIYEFEQSIDRGEEFYKMDDPLYLGRKIFKDFYSRIGQPVPEFIGDRLLSDYYESSVLQWKCFYKMHKDDKNIINVQGDVVSVDLAGFYKDARKADELEKKLPPDVFAERGNPLVLHTDKFFEFIGIDPNTGADLTASANNKANTKTMTIIDKVRNILGRKK